MAPRRQELTSLMRKQFASAKVCWSAVVILQLSALAVAVLALRLGDQAALIVATTGLVAPTLTALGRSRAGAYQGRGEEVRKALLLANGWGRDVDVGLVLVRIAQEPMLAGWDTPPLGSYFNSSRLPGPGRVVQILQQSAFFTARHASTMFWLCVVGAAAVGVGGASMIWVTANGLQPFAHATDVGAALLAFAVGGEVLSIGLAFRRLALVAETTVICCATLDRGAGPDSADLSLALSAYDCAVAQAPPIPSSVYLLQRARLEKAWVAHRRSV